MQEANLRRHRNWESRFMMKLAVNITNESLNSLYEKRFNLYQIKIIIIRLYNVINFLLVFFLRDISKKFFFFDQSRFPSGTSASQRCPGGLPRRGVDGTT
jgi:hypothetical protein